MAKSVLIVNSCSILNDDDTLQDIYKNKDYYFENIDGIDIRLLNLNEFQDEFNKEEVNPFNQYIIFVDYES